MFSHQNTLRDSAQSLQNPSCIYQQKTASLKLLGGKKRKKYQNTRILHPLLTSLRHGDVECAFNKEIITRQTNTAQLKYQEPKPGRPWVYWERQRTQSPASGKVYASKIPVFLEQLLRLHHCCSSPAPFS